MKRLNWKLSAILLIIAALGGCAVQPYDYSALQAAKPRSIVVIPPLNNSTNVEAPYILLSTLTQPLAELGYYVFPVAVIDTLFKENGLPTTAEMNMAPLDKIREIIGADAALYITIHRWGQQYEILSSKAVVSYQFRLLDTRSGSILWDGTAYAEHSSGNSGQGLIGALVTAVVDQMMSSIVDHTPELARAANASSINNGHRGLLQGPYRLDDPLSPVASSPRH